jgi:hypothetical protein
MTMPENVSLIQVHESAVSDLRKLVAAGRLFAVVDASGVPAVPRKASDVGEERAISLYRGSAEEEHWDVAPYLMHLDDALLDWILATLWKEPWGIFVAGRADLAGLRQHLRRLLQVSSPGGEVWLFRFYDPRVLAIFLTICDRRQLALTFGPVAAFGIRSGPEKVAFYQSPSARIDYPAVLPKGPMLAVTQAQFEAFQPLADRAYIEQLAQSIKRRHPEAVEGLSEEALLRRVCVGLGRARSYGLTEDWALSAFVGIMFLVAPNFDQQPGIHRVLTDRTVAADDRLNVMWDETSEADWDEAKNAYDEGAWTTLPAGRTV